MAFTFGFPNWCLIQANTCCNNGPEDDNIGIEMDYSVNNTITFNVCNNNDDVGIFLDGNSNLNLVQANICCYNNDTVDDGDEVGIEVHGSINNTVIQNLCAYNGVDGIWLNYDSFNDTIQSNNCSWNLWNGIEFSTNATSNLLFNNNCSWNLWNGIELHDNASSNLLINNNCSRNLGNGLPISDSYSNKVYGNSFIFNGGNGTYLDNTTADNEIAYNFIIKNARSPYVDLGINNNIHDNVLGFTLVIPLKLQAIASDSAVTSFWQSPLNIIGLKLMGYNIYMGSAAGQEVYYTSIGNYTTFKVTGLTNNQIVLFHHHRRL